MFNESTRLVAMALFLNCRRYAILHCIVKKRHFTDVVFTFAYLVIFATPIFTLTTDRLLRFLIKIFAADQPGYSIGN